MPGREPRHPFFVYGTLRQGGHYNHLIADLGDIKTTPAILPGFLLHCWTDMERGSVGLPYVGVGRKHSDRVIGDLVRVPAEHYGRLRRRLDHLESYRPDEPHNHYIRIAQAVVEIVPGEGTRLVTAWVYIGGPAFERNPVDDGDYIALAQEADEAREARLVAYLASQEAVTGS